MYSNKDGIHRFQISQGVTLGKASRGKYKGYPILGDNVFIGSKVAVIRKVKVENNVLLRPMQ